MELVEVEALIRGPIEPVWARYTDHVSWGRWAGLGPVRLAREGVPAPNGVGCVRVIGVGPLAVHEEILEFEAPRRMTYAIVAGAVPLRDHHGEVTFQAEGDATRIVWRCRFRPALPGTGGLARLLLTRLFRRVLANLSRQPFASHVSSQGSSHGVA